MLYIIIVSLYAYEKNTILIILYRCIFFPLLIITTMYSYIYYSIEINIQL